jgi:hypothetical protein
LLVFVVFDFHFFVFSDQQVPCPSGWLVAICEALKRMLNKHVLDLTHGELPNVALCAHLIDFALETISHVHGSDSGMLGIWKMRRMCCKDRV